MINIHSRSFSNRVPVMEACGGVSTAVYRGRSTSGNGQQFIFSLWWRVHHTSAVVHHALWANAMTIHTYLFQGMLCEKQSPCTHLYALMSVSIHIRVITRLVYPCSHVLTYMQLCTYSGVCINVHIHMHVCSQDLCTCLCVSTCLF